MLWARPRTRTGVGTNMRRPVTLTIGDEHLGSDFDAFLAEQGLLEEVSVTALKRVIAWQLASEMKRQKVTNKALAERMHTSRSLQPLLCCKPRHSHPSCRSREKPTAWNRVYATIYPWLRDHRAPSPPHILQAAGSEFFNRVGQELATPSKPPPRKPGQPAPPETTKGHRSDPFLFTQATP